MKAAWTVLFLSLAAPLSAWAAGDAENGRVVAERWCAACHAIGRPQSTSGSAPAFVSIAQHGRESPEQLRAWLKAPHPPMPNPGLSRQEIEDVIAYLQSLAPPP